MPYINEINKAFICIMPHMLTPDRNSKLIFSSYFIYYIVYLYLTPIQDHYRNHNVKKETIRYMRNWQVNLFTHSKMHDLYHKYTLILAP